MDEPVQQLYPLPALERPLAGTYLAHNLRQYCPEASDVFVYSTFVASVDGRIAIPHPNLPGLTVPTAIANARDWRLYQELAAQADVIISSSRYLKDWQAGRAGEILETADPRFADLRRWRAEKGLAPQPDYAIISGSLKFPIPEPLTAGGRKLLVFTHAGADRDRIAAIEAQGGRVLFAGDESVEAASLVNHLREGGYQTIFSSAGPQILHLLLVGGVLNRLYVTYAGRLLAGQPYAAIVEGPQFQPAVDLKIQCITLDNHAPDGLGQMFVAYDRIG